MRTTIVTTDSTHYLPPELIAEYGVQQVSLYVSWNGTQEREADLTNYGDFFERLRNSSDLPTTSQPSIGDFLAVWEPLLAANQDIVSIHLAAGISGTAGAARQTKAQLEENPAYRGRIHVIDSETTCCGLGMAVLVAATAARQGKSSSEVAQRATAACGNLQIWFSIDTLEYLRRGGRIGSAQAWLGSRLQIKPILAMKREIVAVERVRTSRRAFHRMVEFAHELKSQGQDTWGVQHIQAPEAAERLVAAGREVFGSEPLLVSEIGPVIGTHTGPGLLGIAGISGELLRL